METKWQKSVIDQSGDERHESSMENFTWILEGSFTLSALRYLVEKWDDKSAAWIKVKMFFALHRRLSHTWTKYAWQISEIGSLENSTSRRSVLFKFSNKDSYLWRDTRARFIYRFIALTLFIRVREFFARWSPVPRPGISFDLFIFIFHPLRREIVPITRKKRRSNEAPKQIPAKFRQLRNPRTRP